MVVLIIVKKIKAEMSLKKKFKNLNGKVCAHELEDIISLRCQYYSMTFIDST